MSTSTRESSVPARRGLVGLVRFYWSFGGITALWVIALLIAGAHEPRPALDVAFWGVVASILLARFIDVRRLGGTTLHGVPATMVHVQRHAAVLAMAAGGAWLAAHAVAEWLG